MYWKALTHESSAGKRVKKHKMFSAPKLSAERLSIISNSNWTEWSTIQGVIERVILKSDEHEARGRSEISSTITP